MFKTRALVARYETHVVNLCSNENVVILGHRCHGVRSSHLGGHGDSPLFGRRTNHHKEFRNQRGDHANHIGDRGHSQHHHGLQVQTQKLKSPKLDYVRPFFWQFTRRTRTYPRRWWRGRPRPFSRRRKRRQYQRQSGFNPRDRGLSPIPGCLRRSFGERKPRSLIT